MFAKLLKPLIRRQINAYAREWDYDMSYVLEMLEVSPEAVMKFNGISGMGYHREDTPAAALYAAKLAAVVREDCGPCTQLVTKMAERAGVSAVDLRAILRADVAAMSADASLGFRFAQASLAHDIGADPLRQEIVQRWGQRAVITLAFAMATSRIFPTVKYALGHGHTCVRVRVGGVDTQVAHAVPA